MSKNSQTSSECERQKEAFIEKLVEIIRKSEQVSKKESASDTTHS